MYEPEELVKRHKGLRVSSLAYFRKSVRYCKDRLDEKPEDIDTSYFDLGTKLHYYLLEPMKFNELYVYLDFPVPKTEQQKNYCEEYVKLSRTMGNVEAESQAYKSTYATEKKSESKIAAEAAKLSATYRKYITYLEKSDTYKDTLNYTTYKFLEDAKTSVFQHKKARELMVS